MQRLWIGLAVRDALLREAARMAPMETGGVLMGYRGEGGDVVVTAVIGPGPTAMHARARFLPDHAFQEREIARVYQESGRMHTYLGDWHSHPDGPCTLSSRDRVTLRRIGRERDARVPEPVMVLACGRAAAWDVVAHRLSRGPLWRRIERVPIDVFSGIDTE